METTVRKNTNAQRNCPLCGDAVRGDRIITHILREHTQECFNSHTDEHKKWFTQYELPFIAVYRPKNKTKIDYIACLHCEKGASPFSKVAPDSFYATHGRTCKCKESFKMYASDYRIFVADPVQPAPIQPAPIQPAPIQPIPIQQQEPTVETNSVLASLQAFMNSTKETHDFQDMNEALKFLLESHASQTKTIDTINRNVEKQRKQMREESNRIETEMQTRIHDLEYIVETLRPLPTVQNARTVDSDGLMYWDQLVSRVQNCDPEEEDLKKQYGDQDIDIETYLKNNNNKPLKALYAMYTKFLDTEIEWTELLTYVEEHDYE